MDEPLSNLDAKLRVSMRTSLAEMHERLSVTTVYVTHDQVEAMTLGDRVCVLRDGVLQQVDTPQNLFDRPVNLFVGGFIGSPSMNIVTAQLIRDDGEPTVMFAGHRLPIAEDVVHSRPEIEAYFDRDVILGIRPSDFEEASLVDETWARMSVTTHVTEALGSEINVIFVIDAPPVEHKDVADLVPAAEKGGAAVPLHEGKSMWTARVDAHSRVRAGDQIELGWIPATCTSLTPTATGDRRQTATSAEAIKTQRFGRGSSGATMSDEADPRELLQRYSGNPVLGPRDFPNMVNAVFNPGATLVDGRTLLLLRVEDRTGLSFLVAATSENGLTGWEVDTVRGLQPQSDHFEEHWGIEDRGSPVSATSTSSSTSGTRLRGHSSVWPRRVTSCTGNEAVSSSRPRTRTPRCSRRPSVGGGR